MAGLVEGFIGPPGVAERIRELSKKLPREEVAFKIAEEIVYGKFGHMDEREAAEQAIRTALAILTEGITVAVYSEGIAKVAIKYNPDRTRYLAIYFAGPIRSAGGTETALTPVVGDFVRRLLGLDRYKPTEEEIGRFIEELRLYEREVKGGRFQYHVSDEELRKTLQHLPIEVTGTQTNPVEVSSFRNLPRIETNRVRGGALRVVNDGIIGRSAKVSAIVEALGIRGWDWLKRIRATKQTAGYMEDVIIGRPVFSFPSRRGGFRLRYGRARNTGLAAVGVHPLTMGVLHQFIAAGTQLFLEGPGKSGVVLPVDTLEPPIVRLRDGSVTRLSPQNFEQIKNVVSKILFLGDILIGFGEFLENNKTLLPSGFTEEWWCEELRRAVVQNCGGDLEKAAAIAEISIQRLESFLESPFENKPNAKEAIALASTLGISLHPSFVYFWSNISPDEFLALRQWLLRSRVQVENGVISEVAGAMEEPIKEFLERICAPHKVDGGKVKIENDEARIFAFCLGAHVPKIGSVSGQRVLEIIQDITGIALREKAPTIIGARMGRPEKAKRREMRPLVHVLFPVGLAGGSQRNLVEATNKGMVEVELVRRSCPNCRASTFRIKCMECGAETVTEEFCPQCGRTVRGALCPVCGIPTRGYEKRSVNLKELMEGACKGVNHSPSVVKGVKGLINETKVPEIIEKGILRAKHNLSVFKDGTIRFDATNAPLTHFKAVEINVSVGSLQNLGYRYDGDGNPLTNPDQICELKVQDVIIPLKGAKYFLRVARFLDALLEKVYGLPPYYNIGRAEDLVGHLVVGLAPHTSVGVLGRIIGFTSLNVCYAHPLWHSAKRRDCDGDEDTIMLTLDTILNFSKAYLPAQIGGIMDAPLFIIPVVNPREVQRQVHNMDVAEAYPLLFYEKTRYGTSPQEVSAFIDLVKHRLNTEAQFQGFNYTIPISNVNMGNRESMYKKLKQMVNKLNSQLLLAEKIEAVDAKSVAQRVLTTHFIRDIAGNLRAFTTQAFRCKRCNKRLRRLSLTGKCPECGGVVALTVYRGGIEKYLGMAHQLVERYDLSNYYAQRLFLVEEEIQSLFEGNRTRQVSLTDFA